MAASNSAMASTGEGGNAGTTNRSGQPACSNTDRNNPALWDAGELLKPWI
jgi:hypothetical protein